MDRFQAIERAEPFRHQGHRTWDIFHVWANGAIRDGVRFTSTLHAYVAEPLPTKSRVMIWVPGGEQGVVHSLGWGDELVADAAAWGVASAASVDGADIQFFWELSAGKGETEATRGGPAPHSASKVRVPPAPPPGAGGG